jgi:HEAT repeat protein
MTRNPSTHGAAPSFSREAVGRSVLGSLERAMRLFRSFGLGQRGLSPKSKRRTTDAPLPHGASEQMRKLQSERRNVAARIERLESELERLHDEITSGRAPHSDATATTERGLEASVARSRRIRDAIQERRLELLRIERNIAREAQLSGAVQGAPGSGSRPGVAARTGAGVSPSRDAQTLRRRRAVLKALKECKLPDASEQRIVRRLAAALTHSDAEVRRSAVRKLAQRPRPAIPLLQHAAHDAAQTVRLAAIAGLAGTRSKSVAETLTRGFGDSSAVVRVAALRGLAALDATLPTAPLLRAALEDTDPAVRRTAATLASARRNVGKRSELQAAVAFALYDADASVRAAAAQALGTAGDERVVLALIRAVADESPEVREAASAALRSIVPAASDVPADGLSPANHRRVLETWWREARVAGEPGSNRDLSVVAAAAREAALRAVAEAPAPKRPPAEVPPAPKTVASPAPAAPTPPANEPEEEAEAGAAFESVLGDEETTGGDAPAPEAAGGEAGDDSEGVFESVFDDGAESDDESDEEYENVLGDKE